MVELSQVQTIVSFQIRLLREGGVIDTSHDETSRNDGGKLKDLHCRTGRAIERHWCCVSHASRMQTALCTVQPGIIVMIVVMSIGKREW